MVRRRNSVALRDTSLWRTLRVALASCAILAGGLVLLAAPALAVEGKPPVIVSMSAAAGGEVTVGAEINPEGLETSYEIRLECGTGEPVPCDSLPNERATGELPAVNERRSVSLTLTGLQAGTYWFGVSAHNAAGEALRSSDIFTIPPESPGACPDGCSTSEPYKPEVSPV
jgi:hypothetical protein